MHYVRGYRLLAFEIALLYFEENITAPSGGFRYKYREANVEIYII